MFDIIFETPISETHLQKTTAKFLRTSNKQCSNHIDLKLIELCGYEPATMYNEMFRVPNLSDASDNGTQSEVLSDT